jgi:hypothetical protein
MREINFLLQINDMDPSGQIRRISREIECDNYDKMSVPRYVDFFKNEIKKALNIKLAPKLFSDKTHRKFTIKTKDLFINHANISRDPYAMNNEIWAAMTLFIEDDRDNPHIDSLNYYKSHNSDDAVQLLYKAIARNTDTTETITDRIILHDTN